MRAPKFSRLLFISGLTGLALGGPIRCKSVPIQEREAKQITELDAVELEIELSNMTPAKKAAAVTLLDIYTVIEGPMEIKACLMNHPVCEHPHCPIGKAIAKSGKEFRNLLKNTKLAEIVKRVAK